MVNIVKFQDYGISLDARVEGGQVWITYQQVGQLFGIDESVVGKHARSIIDEGELPASVTARFAVTANDGKSYQKTHLNQEMVAHIGYRVRSDKGIEFRRWATAKLVGDPVPQLPVPADVDPMTALQLAQTAALQFLAKQHEETRVIANDAFRRVTSLEEHARLRAAEVDATLALPPPTVGATPKTDGQRTIEVARSWAIEHNNAFREAFGLLYKEVRYRLRVDLERRAKGKGSKKRQSDIIDESGKAPEIYAIACDLFRLKRSA